MATAEYKVTRLYGADGMEEEYERINPGPPISLDQYTVSTKDMDEWKTKKKSGDEPLELLLMDQSRIPSAEEMKFIKENIGQKIIFLKKEPVICLYAALGLTVGGSDGSAVVDRMILASDTFNSFNTLSNWLHYSNVANAIVKLYNIYESAIEGIREQAFDEHGKPKINVRKKFAGGYCEPSMSSSSFCLGIDKCVLYFSDQEKLITFVSTGEGTYCVVTDVLISGHTLDDSMSKHVRRTEVYYSTNKNGKPYLYNDYNSRQDLKVGCTHSDISDSNSCHKYFCDTIRTKGKLDKRYCPKLAWMYASP